MLSTARFGRSGKRAGRLAHERSSKRRSHASSRGSEAARDRLSAAAAPAMLIPPSELTTDAARGDEGGSVARTVGRTSSGG